MTLDWLLSIAPLKQVCISLKYIRRGLFLFLSSCLCRELCETRSALSSLHGVRVALLFCQVAPDQLCADHHAWLSALQPQRSSQGAPHQRRNSGGILLRRSSRYFPSRNIACDEAGYPYSHRKTLGIRTRRRVT